MVSLRRSLAFLLLSSSLAAAAAPRLRHVRSSVAKQVEARSEELFAERDDTDSSLYQITSPDGVNTAFASSNGNLYLEPTPLDSDSDGFDTSTLFYGDDDGNLYSDYDGRMPHIYSAELQAYGVSRLRFHDPTAMPVTSEFVYLAPFANSRTNSSTLVAVTTTSDTIFLAACNIENQLTKVFAIQTYPDGLDILMSTEMQSLVTGGVVDECVLIDLTNGATGASVSS